MEEEKVLEINPHKCYFIASYPDGKIVKGNALSGDAWSKISSGIMELRYTLSNGSEIVIPKGKAYLSRVDSADGVYFAIDVRYLSEKAVIVYRINLRQVPGSSLRIGDVIVGSDSVPNKFDSSWKMSN
jgi:hypothetical protein